METVRLRREAVEQLMPEGEIRTQEQVAKVLGVHRSSISRQFSGANVGDRVLAGLVRFAPEARLGDLFEVVEEEAPAQAA